MPEGEGRGLLSADAEPPAGAACYERPSWRLGDASSVMRGGIATATFTVDGVTSDSYWVRGPGGVRMRRDLDLGHLGEWGPEGDAPLHVLSPVDMRFHWPLWVGKQWRCEYVDRAPGGRPLRIEAHYVVEALETITVRAGTYETLRIARRLRLVDGGPDRMVRTQLIWYAPSIGIEVRQLLGDAEFELVEWRRGE